MRLVGVGVADALHDAQGIVLQQFGQSCHLGMQAQLVVDFLDLGCAQLQRRSQLGVFRIFERYNCVEAIVAAVQLDDDEDGVLGPGLVREGRRRGRSAHKEWYVEAPGDDTAGGQRRLQKRATIRIHDWVLC